MKKLMFDTYPSTLKKGTASCYIGRTLTNGTVYRSDLVKRIAARSGIEEKQVDYICGLLMDQIGVTFSNGQHLELGSIAGNLAIQGGFPSKDAPWDSSRNKLVAHLHAKGELAASLAGITCENVTKSPTVMLQSVVDTVHKTESELITGTNVTIYASGVGLITSTDVASGEGCWLEDEKTGLVAAIGAVTGSTATTLNANFAEMPEPGAYRFVVATRSGMGSEYGVAQAKRKVTVVAAD